MYNYYEDGPSRNRDEDLIDRADRYRTERKDREMEELWAKEQEEKANKKEHELETN